MKKIIILISVILVTFMLIFFSSKIIFAEDKQENDNALKYKIKSEIEYLESQLISLLNDMNNIKFENYKISVSEVPEESASDESEGGESGGQSSKSSGSSSSSSSGGSSSNQTGEGTEKTTKQYKLQENGILISDTNPNWNVIKNKIEEMYISISTITLDLYKVNINKKDILDFNTELDNLTIAIKSEDKQKTLDILTLLYSYLPKYMDTIGIDENYTNILKTKSNVFYAYSLLDKKDWQNMNNYNQIAIDIFSNILNNIPSQEKEYAINKAYILLNELKNPILLKDKEIYLIKYKNLLEQLNNL